MVTKPGVHNRVDLFCVKQEIAVCTRTNLQAFFTDKPADFDFYLGLGCTCNKMIPVAHKTNYAISRYAEHTDRYRDYGKRCYRALKQEETNKDAIRT